MQVRVHRRTPCEYIRVSIPTKIPKTTLTRDHPRVLRCNQRAARNESKLYARRTVSVRHIQRLQRPDALLAHLAPRPAALDHRLAPRMQPRPDRVRAERVQLLLPGGEVRFARLQLRLRRGHLLPDLHLGLRDAQRRAGRGAVQYRVSGGLLLLRRLDEPRYSVGPIRQLARPTQGGTTTRTESPYLA